LSQGDQDLWLDTKRRLAFRLHHNFLLTGAKLSPIVRTRYFQDILRAYDGVYTASSAMGALPLALAGDIYFLRPPKPTSRDRTLYLGSWIVPESVAPYLRQYLLHPVPVLKSDKCVPMPLETTVEAADREREDSTGSAGIRQPNSLAAARAERH
jgi:hypothetical protein